MTARLWAPWRKKFLTHPKPKGCIFCAFPKVRHDRKNLLLERGRTVFSLLNLYPYNNGHLMIAPYRHIGAMDQLRPAEWAETLQLSQTLLRRLRAALRPHAFNIGMNLGRSAGAGIPGHLHLHIVPRWNGDTNFMPVLGRTKVLSQSLDELYAALTRARRPRRAR